MQEYNLYSETDTRKIIIGKLQRMFSSCQINVLVGSAFSLPQLKTLENIESDLTTAILEQDENKEYKIKKNFFEKSIKPIQTTNPNGNDFKKKREFIFLRKLKRMQKRIQTKPQRIKLLHTICVLPLRMEHQQMFTESFWKIFEHLRYVRRTESCMVLIS